jgi:hypothetical protein
MVINFTNINKTNNHFSSQLNSLNTTITRHMTLEIHVLVYELCLRPKHADKTFTNISEI